MFDDEHDCLKAFVGSKCFASQTSSHACRVFCHSRYSLCHGSSIDQGDGFLLSEYVSTGIRAASARSQVCMSHLGVSRAPSLTLWIKSGRFRFSVDWARAFLSRSLSRRAFGVCVLPVLNHRLFKSSVCAWITVNMSALRNLTLLSLGSSCQIPANPTISSKEFWRGLSVTARVG